MRWLRIALLVSAIVSPSILAEAQEWTSTSLGTTAPMWIEGSAEVTSNGDVAWTSLDGDEPAARVYQNGAIQSLHAVGGPPNYMASFAHDMTDSLRVVGHFASDRAELFRRARMWFPQGAGWSSLDLHAAVPANAQQSSAYAITDAPFQGFIIAGMVREKISAASLPYPVVWEVVEGTATFRPLQMGSFNHGVARAVGHVGSTSYACGAIGSSNGGYNAAACWNLSTQSGPILPSFASDPGHLSSSWTRMRRVEIAPGVEQLIVGGYVVDASMTFRAVIHNLHTGETIYPMELVPGAQTMFSDLRAFVVEGKHSAEKDYGIEIIGLSGTTASASVLDTGAGPRQSVSSIRAVMSRLLPGMHSTTQVPMGSMRGLAQSGTLNDQTSGATPTLYQAVAVAPNGLHMLANAGGSLLLLQKPAHAMIDVRLISRDLRTRRTRAQAKADAPGTNATHILYHWFELEGLLSVDEAYLAWSDDPGYEQLSDVLPMSGACAVVGHAIGLESDAVKLIPVLSSSGAGTLSTTFFTGTDFANYRYFRLFYRKGGQCYATPIQLTRATQKNREWVLPYDTEYDWDTCLTGTPAGEFDTDVNTSYDHCGACGNSCHIANAAATCVAGSCVMPTECDSGWVNLNGDWLDGCECKYISAQDFPDRRPDFIDSNCDGIDGEVANSVFVAKWGANGASCGTQTAPCLTIQQGIARAKALGRRDVLIGAGSYTEMLQLESGISLYGGYAADSASNWVRHQDYAVTVTGGLVDGHGSVVRGNGLTAATVLNRIEFIAPNAQGNGRSSVAILCQNCPGLDIDYVTARAGVGTDGWNGGDGTTGANGGNGGRGTDGNNDSTAGHHGNPGGSAGSSTCGRAGGVGGVGARDRNGGATGAPGAAGGGAGGTGGGTPSRCGRTHGNPGGAGNWGSNGQNGVGGNSGYLNGSGLWLGFPGADGVSGGHGWGGGGGGGGSGQGGSNISNWCIHGTGNAGGGGGGGGCGGTRGTGGVGGGSSIAVLLSASSGANVRNSNLHSQQAGRGGTGGDGKAGGLGGAAGLGADRHTGEVGRGGNGGSGGGGGHGGHGGGGAGGYSVNILMLGASAAQSGNTFNVGTAGAGGGSSGSAGVAGVATAVRTQ